jgi:BolA protein
MKTDGTRRNEHIQRSRREDICGRARSALATQRESGYRCNTDARGYVAVTGNLPRTVDLIRERLAILSPRTLDIHDDSHAHAGHAGARESGGGHFQVMLVSNRFEGKNQIARHRMIYQAVADLMPDKIHALAIKAYTSSEFEESNEVG